MILSTDTVNMDEKPVEEGIDNKGFVDNVQTNNVTSHEKQSSEKGKSIEDVIPYENRNLQKNNL